MKLSKDQLRKRLDNRRFPCSSRYDPEWVLENEMGPNALWLTEWLCEEMNFRPGMRVLDMGCGRCLSSVYLAKEFDVQVWANDLWISATENWERIRQAGCGNQIFPIHAEAHALPYAESFFDAIVCLDSYHYYGTDDVYLNYFLKFLKPGGQIGIVVAAQIKEFKKDIIPAHLKKFWDPSECFSLHTLEWWIRQWKKTQLVDIQAADVMAGGWKEWLKFEELKTAIGTNRFPHDEPALRADKGRYLGLARLVAQRNEIRK
jgi:cyclopropane fatty-acyl-phospholipid synthase-like methyltransferase